MSTRLTINAKNPQRYKAVSLHMMKILEGGCQFCVETIYKIKHSLKDSTKVKPNNERVKELHLANFHYVSAFESEI